jgi:predicted lipoprotein
VALETRDLSDAWTVSFQDDDPWTATYTATMTSNQALGDVVGAIVETLKRQSLLELGKGLAISAPKAEIEAIPEGAAGEGAFVYRGQLVGVRTALDAGGETSLLALIAARDRSVADRIQTLLDNAVTALDAIDGPIRDLAAERPGELEPIYESLAELRTLFEADVVSLLDITLGFSDTDGDTG